MKSDFIAKNKLRKERRIMVRFPRRSLQKVRNLIVKYELKGMQDLFDSLVVGGLVFRRSEIIDFIREHRPKYEELHKLNNLSRLGKAKKPEQLEMYGINMVMYNHDHTAFKNYIIEENIKQQWVWTILFEDGFAAEAPPIVALVQRQSKLEITSRKKAVARLANDEYIRVLPTSEAEFILNQLTTEYDNREFDDSLEEVIKAKIALKEAEEAKEEEDLLEKDFDNKIINLRRSRAQKINEISKPKLDLE